MATQDLVDLHGRLLNHRPFLQGEIQHFVREFESKRQDREVERVFGVLERVTDLRDCEVDKLTALCDSTVPNVKANLLVAQSMCNKILEQGQSSEIEQALESSRQSRDKEWQSFLSDVQDKCSRIDDAYQQKEKDLIKQYRQMEQQLADSSSVDSTPTSSK